MRLYILFILILSASFAFGQSTTTQITENRQTFAPEGEEFSVEASARFLPSFKNAAAVSAIASRAYRAVSGGAYYYVFSDPLKNPAQNKYVFDFAKFSADRNQENTISKFKDNFGYYHRVLSVKTSDKVYTFQAFSRDENNWQIDEFFASIKVESKTPELKQPLAEDKKIYPLPIAKETRTGGTGSGNGSGSGNGIGDGTTTAQPTATAPAQTSPIRILSKPRPPYTDYARFYEIDGVVRLRVTFLAKGEIGSVVPLTTLPFGLTEMAIEAARGVKFEPAKRDGIPVSLTKVIEYNFIIY